MCGAMAAGLQGILVKTGKYRPGDEEKVDTVPSFVADDFPHAVNYLIENGLSLA